MAASSTRIVNYALFHIGHGKTIASLDEKSQAAQVANLFYDEMLDETLRDFDWPFAKRFVALGLVESNPTTEWARSYRYPANAVKLRRILSGKRRDDNDSTVRYEVGSDDTGRLIYTDHNPATLEYTHRITNVALYPSDFVLAFSLRLSLVMAPSLTAGDPFKIENSIIQKHDFAMSKARANSLGEQKPDPEPDSEFERAR